MPVSFFVFKRIENSLNKLIIATQECSQSLDEFNAEYNSIKNKYHPVIWFFMNLFA